MPNGQLLCGLGGLIGFQLAVGDSSLGVFSLNLAGYWALCLARLAWGDPGVGFTLLAGTALLIPTLFNGWTRSLGHLAGLETMARALLGCCSLPILCCLACLLPGAVGATAALVVFLAFCLWAAREARR